MKPKSFSVLVLFTIQSLSILFLLDIAQGLPVTPTSPNSRFDSSPAFRDVSPDAQGIYHYEYSKLKGPTKVNTASATQLESQQKQADSCQRANEVIPGLLKLLNTLLPQVITSQHIDLFGINNNSLDPLNFNQQVKAEVSDKVCAPQKCLSIFGKNICTPAPCAGGSAYAELKYLYGLSTMNATSARCDGAVDFIEGNRTNLQEARGHVLLSLDYLTIDAQVGAKTSLVGINIPIDVSGKITLQDLNPDLYFTFIMTYEELPTGKKKFQIEKVKSSSLKLSYNKIKIDIAGLGPLNKLLTPLVNALKSVIDPFFDVNGAIAKAIDKEMNSILENAIPQVNTMLGFYSF